MATMNWRIISTLVTLMALLIGLTELMGVFRKKRKISKFGISVLYSPMEPKDSKMDIVFVHSIGDDSRSAWSNDGFKWPVSELPKILERNRCHANILAYDYDSKFRTVEYLTRRTLLHQAEALIEALVGHQKQSGQRPTLFVCHSLGGLLLKNALVSAKASDIPEFKTISDSVAGIVFLGTPHYSSPSALTKTLCSILNIKKESDTAQDLANRSTTLVCNLERFKPLAACLPIHNLFVETNSTTIHDEFKNEQDTANSGSSLHKQYRIGSKHVQLNKFSTPEDVNLKKIINSIGEICFTIINGTSKPEIADKPKFGYDGVCDLGLDETLEKRCKSISKKPVSKKLIELREYFVSCENSARESDLKINSPHENQFGSVGILEGGSGCGKSQISLRYVNEYHNEYGSILWINAKNQKSLELSFRSIAQRMILHSKSDRRSATVELGLGGINLDQTKDLEEEEFYTVVLSVTEWLSHPQRKKWLLVLDGLSLNVGYPDSDIWTRQLGKRRPSKNTWAFILPLIPSTANKRGDIIISTRDKVTGVGCKVIEFPTPNNTKSSYLSIPQGLTGEKEKTCQEIRSWWGKADGWKRHVLETVQFLSDAECRYVPGSLLQQTLLENQKIKDLKVPGLHYDGSSLQPSELLLELGIDLFSKLGVRSLGQSLKEAATRSWKTLDKTIDSTRSRPDLIFVWDFEAQMVENIRAAWRRCAEFLTEKELGEIFSSADERTWAKLGTICENHAQFPTAIKLYQLERSRYDQGTEACFSLELDCARAYQRNENYPDAESAYSNIFSDKYTDVSFDKRQAAYRQFASLKASTDNFGEAADKLIGVLALEGPFGLTKDQKPVADSMVELAAYLKKTGNKSAASALLQRRLVSLEDTKGGTHPKTLAIMEALSAMKLEEGELQEARRLLNYVYDCQKERLGETHPITIRCRSKVATTWDLEGQTKEAESKYREILNLAAESLVPHHPVVSGIREDFARFLLTQGKTSKAKGELDTLIKEVETFGGLYPSSFVQGIRRLQDPQLDVDDLDQNMLFVRRNTLGAGGLYEDAEEEDDDYKY